MKKIVQKQQRHRNSLTRNVRFMKFVRGSESCSLSTLKQPPWLNMLAGGKNTIGCFRKEFGVFCAA